MPTYTIETARGRKLKIESDSPEAATRLADTWDLEDHAASEAARMGLNPDVALRQMRQESGSRSDAISPKGARGPMQLMPGTARELGVNADDPYANITGGLTYYKKQLDANGGDERRALAAYNAGPGAVARAGGVPNYPETINYVNTIMGPEGAPVARPKPPPLPGQPGAVPVHQMGPGVTMERAAPYEGMKSEALGFKTEIARIADRLAPFSPANLIPGFREANAASGERLKASLAQQAQQREPGKIGAFGGGVLASAALAGPTSPLVSGAISGAATGNATDLKGVLGETAFGAAIGRGSALASDAVQLAARKVLSKAPKIMDLPALQKASDATWDAVDASGFRFAKSSVQKTADDIARLVDDAGPELYGEAAKIARRVADLAKRGQLSVAQANRLRSQVGEKLLQPGSTEASLGALIKGKIDALIDSADDPAIKGARELYTRLMKTKNITNRLDDAAINQATSGTGGNRNAVRQSVKPLIKSGPQKMRNATKAENAALRRVANGGVGQNIARALSAFDPTAGKLTALLQGGGALATGGMSAATIPVGMAASAVETALQARNVKKLLDLVAVGGSKQALARVPTKTSQAVETVIARGARPALVVASVPALAAARAPNRKDGKRPNSR